MERNKRKILVSIISLLCLIIVILLLRFVVFDNYKGKINVKNVASYATVLSANVSNLTSESNVSESYDTVKYTIKYTLENDTNILRNAIIEARLTASESKYARFKEIKGNGITSTVSEDGIVVNMSNVPTNEEQSLELTLVISNAPYGFKVKPNVTVKEETSDEQTINMDEITVNRNSIEGYVLNDNGNKLSSIELSLYENGNEVRRTYTNTDGEYVFGNLDPNNNYIVYVEEDAYKKIRTIDRSTSTEKRVLDIVVDSVDPFNLEINKYITGLKINNNGKVEEYAYADEAKVLKSIKKLKNLSGSIYYKISIKNTGEVNGTIGSIQDIIPEGLSFDSKKNPGWEEKNGKLYYRVLEDQTLTSYEERTANLVLDIKNTNVAKTYINEVIGKSEEYKNVVFLIDGNIYKDIYVLAGETIDEVTIQDEGFSGWYTDANYTNKYKFGKEVDKNMILYGSLTSRKCKVTFIDDGNTLSENEIDCGTKVSSITPAGKNGYTFKYWTLNNQQYDFDTLLSEDIVLVSYYEIDVYDIAYNLDGGILENQNPITYTVETPAFMLNNPTKEGYTFTGWTGSNGNIPGDVTIMQGTTGDKEYTANYDINSYTLIIDPNGGIYESSNNPVPISGNYNSIISIASPTREGYTFTGWSLEGKGTFENGNYTYGDGNGRLVANYTPKTYTIDYVLNGGSVSTSNPTEYTIESDTIVLNNPTKEGFTFTGWTGTDLTNPSTVVTIPQGSIGNRQYTANFSINSYALTVDPNGGEYNSSFNPISITNDFGTILTLDTPTRIGYSFAGWTLTGSGSLTENVYTYADGNGTVTANWNIIKYNISYEGLTTDELSALNNPTEYDVESSFSLTNPQNRLDNEGDLYERFTGWTYGQNTETNVTIPVGTTGNITFTANFVHVDPDVYTISYELNGGEVSVANPSSYTKKDNNITLNNPTKTGYNFAGWVGTGLTEPTMTVTIPHGSIGDREYTATYTPIVYTITYNLGGGTVTGTNPVEYTIESETFTLINPTKEGYTFTGWTGSNGDTPANVTITQGTIGNKEYTANYTEDGYSITYDLVGGSVSTPNPISYTVESNNITLNNPTKTGYTFTGWTGTGLTEPTMTVVIPKGSTGNRSYIATYTPEIYTITYNLSGGTLSEANPVEYTIESESFTLNSPSKEGYTFAGWTGSNGDTPASVTIPKGTTGNKEYTANFRKVDYTISYNLDGGVVEGTNPTGYSIESNDITLINPTKEGYTFAGWTGTDITNPSTTVTIPSGSIGNRSYVAHYTPVIYTITYEGLTPEEMAVINNPTEYTIEDNSFTLTNPTRAGYTFTGWTGSNGTNPLLTVTINHGTTGNKNYIANFDINSYTVTYKNNESTFYTEVVSYKGKTTAPTTDPVKTHAYFSHWSLEENGTPFDFDTEIVDNTTLYAVFTSIDAPTITHTPTTWTNQDVTVNVTSSHNDYEYYYKVGDGSYAKYEDNFVVSENTTVYAYSKYGNGQSTEASHQISNIDKLDPTISTTYVPTAHAIELDMDFQDNESGVKSYEIYFENVLVYSSPDYTSNLNELKHEIFTFNSLDASTEYSYRVELTDVAGNTTVYSSTAETAAAVFVAQVIGMGGIIYNDPSQYELFESLQAAISYCSTTQCTVQIIPNLLEESVVVTQGQDITLDLDGKTLTSSELTTIENNGKLLIVDHKEQSEAGTIANTNVAGTAIVNNDLLIIGEDDNSVSVIKPLVLSTNIGVDNNSRLNFFDGKVKAEIALHGEVTQTPYSFNASISSEDNKEVMTLQRVEEPEARINSKYYTSLASAFGESKTGIVEDSENETLYLSQIKQVGTYGFSYNPNEHSIISENAGINSSLSLSVLELDLTEYTENQILSINYSIKSEEGLDYGYVTIKEVESNPAPTDTVGRFIYASGFYENYTRIKELEAGKKYYIYFGYNKNELWSYYDDTFKINSLSLNSKSKSDIRDGFVNDGLHFEYVDSYRTINDLSGNIAPIPYMETYKDNVVHNISKGSLDYNNSNRINLYPNANIGTEETIDIEFSATKSDDQYLYRAQNGEKISIRVNGNSYIGFGAASSATVYAVPSDFYDGNKHRITVSYNNGTFDAIYDGQPMTLGTAQNNGGSESFASLGSNFNGSIYNIRMYDKVVTANDIDNNLYSQNLKMHYDFSDSNVFSTVNESVIVPSVIGNNTAHSYVVFDLRGESESTILRVETSKYTPRSEDTLRICVTNSEANPGTSCSTGGLTISNTTYRQDALNIINLVPNQINYVHLNFSKYRYPDNNGIIIKNFEIAREDSVNSIYDKEIIDDPTYHFVRYNSMILKDLSENGHDYTDQITSSLYDYSTKSLFFRGKRLDIPNAITATTEETVDVEFSTTNTGNKILYSGNSNSKIALGVYNGHIVVAAMTKSTVFVLPSNFSDGSKHRITGTYKEGTYKVYFDGVELAQDTSTTESFVTNNNTSIGGRYDDSYAFHGNIYSVKEYNKAFTPEEIDSNTVNEYMQLYYDVSDPRNIITDNHTYISNNQGIHNSTAHSAIKYDLTNSGDRYIVVDYTISSERNCDYGYITLNSSPVNPGKDDTVGRYVYVSNTGTGSVIIKIPGGTVSYLHLGYYKDQSKNANNDLFMINSIRYVDDIENTYTITPNSIVSDSQAFKVPRVNENVSRIELLKDVTVDYTIDIPMEKEVILDLNGYVLDTSKSDYIINNKGILTIDDSDYDDQKSAIDADYRQALEEYNDLIDETLAKLNSGELEYINRFNYTGEEKVLPIIHSGTYKIESWGASGGDAGVYTGGYGGYSTGEVYLNAGEKLYINVGGQGKTAANAVIGGGYNGGGDAGPNSAGNRGSGGGASSVATASGLLSELSENRNDVIIVSAGGGGANVWNDQYGYGGSGGGFTGVDGTTQYHTIGKGGTQIEGGAGSRVGTFGKGANAITGSPGGAGGGGGYFGGGSSRDNAGAGGGSSYIGNSRLTNKSMFCYDCAEATDTTTDVDIFTISTTGSSSYVDSTNCPDGYSTDATSKCAKDGNGYVTVQFIPSGGDNPFTREDAIEYVTRILGVTEPQADYNSLIHNGKITSNTSSAILNDDNATMTIKNSNIVMDREGAYSAIVNQGTLIFGENNVLVANKKNSIALRNETQGIILPGEDVTINAVGTNSIGILHESYKDQTLSNYDINLSNTSYGIYDRGYAHKNIEDISIKGSGFGIVTVSNYGITANNLVINSDSNNVLFDSTNVSVLELRPSSKYSFNNSNFLYSGSDAAIKGLVGSERNIEINSCNVDSTGSGQAIRVESGIVTINSSTLNTNGYGLYNLAQSTISNSTINTKNMGIYNDGTYNGLLTVSNTTIDKMSGSDVNIISNVNRGNIYINDSHISSSVASTGIYNDSSSIVNIEGESIIDGSNTVGINNIGTLIVGDNNDIYNTQYDYGYTGSVQTFTAPESGNYRFETWGAAGGRGSYDSWVGGKGAYAAGDIYLEAGTKLYIYVGEAGLDMYSSTNSTTSRGSYNGGGTSIDKRACYYSCWYDLGGVGGGATDISISNEENHVEHNKRSNIYARSTQSYVDRIMVAGAGAGGNESGLRQCVNGVKLSLKDVSCGSGINVTTGTQVTGNFGYSPIDESYGGKGAGYFTSADNLATLNTGGTSYISGYTGSVAMTNSQGIVRPISVNGQVCSDGTSDVRCSYHTSGYVFTNTVMKAGYEEMPAYNGDGTMIGNTGNGHARITFLDGGTTNVVNTEYPKISGTAIAIRENNSITSAKVYFYDGVLEGSNKRTLESEVTFKPDGYDTYVDNTETIEKIYLVSKDTQEDSEFVVAKLDSSDNVVKKYTSISDAISDTSEDLENTTKLLVLKNIKTSNQIVVPNTKNITIDYNGFYVDGSTEGYLYENNGILNIINSGSKSNYNISHGEGYLLNNGTTSITNIYLTTSTSTSKNIINNGTLTFNDVNYTVPSDLPYIANLLIYNSENSTLNINNGQIVLDHGKHRINVIDNFGTLNMSGTTFNTAARDAMDTNYFINNEIGAVANISNATISHNDWDSVYVFMNNYGTATVSNTTLNRLKTFNYGTMLLENVTTVEYNWNGADIHNNDGTLTIDGGVYNENHGNFKGSVRNNGSANMIIKAGTFTNQIIHNSTGSLVIEGGTVNTLDSTAISVNQGGSLTLGIKSDGNVSTSSPVINGNTFGIKFAYDTSTFNFYDGIVKGTTAISGSVNETEPGYSVYLEMVNGKENKYLVNTPAIKNLTTGTEYNDVGLAFSEANNDDTLQFQRNTSISRSESTINNSKTLTIDLNGNTVDVSNENFINNTGNITIIDSKYDNGNYLSSVANAYSRLSSHQILYRTYDFAYTGYENIFVAPYTGTYKISLWGAQGAGGAYAEGGRGAYTSGTISLNKGDKLYVHVGNQPTGQNNSYNGGNKGGGGATDVSIESGNNKSRIMVAAGGGYSSNRSATNYAFGGAGGALTGLPGNSNTPAQGGTQTDGGIGMNNTTGSRKGTFGTGGDAGGGGGYYGGGGAWDLCSAAGGSSYISGYTGSVAVTSATDGTPKSGCSTGTSDVTCSYHYSGMIFGNTVMKSGEEIFTNYKGEEVTGNAGNGFARITLISSPDAANIESSYYDAEAYTAEVSGIHKPSTDNIGSFITSTLYPIITNNGTLTINGGKFTDVESNGYTTLFRNNGTMIINDGVFIKQYGVVPQTSRVEGSIIENNSSLTVKGGSFDLNDVFKSDTYASPALNTFVYNKTGATANIIGGHFISTKVMSNYARGRLFYNEGVINIKGVASNYSSIGYNNNEVNIYDLSMVGLTPSNTFFGEGVQDCQANNRNCDNGEPTIGIFTNLGTVNMVGGVYSTDAQFIYNMGTFNLNQGTDNITSLRRANLTGDKNKNETHKNKIIRIMPNSTTNINGLMYESAFNNNNPSYTIFNGSTNNLNITNSDFYNSGKEQVLYNNVNGDIIIDNSKLRAANNYAINNVSTGNIVIKNNSEIISDSTAAIYNTAASTITVGTKTDGVVSLTYPMIKGATYGIQSTNNTAIFNFYDGILKGKTNHTNLSFSEVEPGYTPSDGTETIDGATYKTKYLDRVEVAENGSTFIRYYDLASAVAAASNNDTIYIINNYTTLTSDPLIEIDKNITIDLQGHIIYNSQDHFIKNNGTLTIVDSLNNGNGLLHMVGGTDMIDNYGTLIIDGAKLSTQLTTSFIINEENATMNVINNSDISSSVLTSVIVNNGLLNISDSRMSMIRTGDNYTEAGIIRNNATGVLNVNDSILFAINNFRHENALINYGTATLDNVEFSENGYRGLALFNNSSGTVTLQNINNVNPLVINRNLGVLNIIDSNILLSKESIEYEQTALYSDPSGTLNVQNTTFRSDIDTGFFTRGTANYEDVTIVFPNKSFNLISYGTTTIDNLEMKGENGVETNSLVSISGGTTTIKDSNLRSNAGTVINTSCSTTNIQNSNITSVSNNGNALKLECDYNDTRVNIKNGTVINSNGNGINVVSPRAILSLGTNDASYDSSSPTVTSNAYAVYNTVGTFYFYDGYLKGVTKGHYGNIHAVEDGYRVVTKTEDGYNVTYQNLVDTTATVAESNSISFDNLQTAINYGVRNNTHVNLVVRTLTLDSDLTASGPVTLYLNGNELNPGGYNISSNITVESGSYNPSGSISNILGNILGIGNENKEIIVYEMDDGSSLDSSVSYRLYKNNELQKMDEEEAGTYSIGSDIDVLKPIKGRIYLRKVQPGNYRLVGSDNKEVLFSVDEDGKLTGNVKEYTIKSNNYISNAKAELVLTIQTGIRRINYMLIALSLVGILFIMFIVRRKRENS